MRLDGRAARARDALTLLLSCVLLASACTRCGQRPPKGASVDQGPNHASAGWTCRIGSRGGFTGGGSGSIVRADGTILTWSQITPDESLTTEPAGHASSPALRQAYDAALAAVRSAQP